MSRSRATGSPTSVPARRARPRVSRANQEALARIHATAPDLTGLSRRLLSWYRKHRRDLPWRRTQDPYAIWVSEIMLQQTRVETVLPYYETFLRRFPDVETLARAEEETVLSLWSGLGYYSRARNLHRGARRVLQRHGGRFPPTYDEAIAIPGVGPYTAAAILSIAYGEPHAVVDGNVSRVLARLYRLDPPWDGNATILRWLARDLLSEKRAGDHNQAMMELGARICVPRNPDCAHCPLRKDCAAFRDGETRAYPRVRPRKGTVDMRLRLLLLRDGRGRLLLEKGRWKMIRHLWLPPIVPDDEGRVEPGHGPGARPVPGVEAESASNPAPGPEPEPGGVPVPGVDSGTVDLWPWPGGDRWRELGRFRHSITHHRIRFRVLAADLRYTSLAPDQRLVAPDDLAALGRSSIVAKALELEAQPD